MLIIQSRIKRVSIHLLLKFKLRAPTYLTDQSNMCDIFYIYIYLLLLNITTTEQMGELLQHRYKTRNGQ